MVDSAALAKAPAFNASSFNGSVGSDVAQFWSGQGVSIPATGANSSNSSAVLIQGSITGLNAVDSSGQAIGQITDFVINMQTGQLAYAVMVGSAGGSSSSSSSSSIANKLFVVPMSVFTWTTGASSSASSTGTPVATATASSSSASSGNDMGQLQAKVSTSAFEKAPTIDSITMLNVASSGWNSKIDSYWSTAK